MTTELVASIIVPTKNRAKTLRSAIESFFFQKIDSKFEVIIVDNDSDDDTWNIAKELKNKSPSNSNLVYQLEKTPGLLSARHRGVKVAKSDITIFCDDDIKADPLWLTSILKAFKDPKISLVGGPAIPLFEIEPPDWTKELWTSDSNGSYCPFYSLIDLGSSGKIIDPTLVFGLNYSIRKNVLFKCGGFNPDSMPSALQKYQGDGETGLSEKLRAHGFKAWYEPLAKVNHLVPSERLTIEYIYKRSYFQGIANSYSIIRKHKKTSFALKLRQPKLFAKALIHFFNKAQFDELSKKPINCLIKKGIADGFWFHQIATQKDPDLLNWILKPDYLNYDLPLKP